MWLFRKVYFDYSKEKGLHIVDREVNKNDVKQFFLFILASILFMVGALFFLYIVAVVSSLTTDYEVDNRIRTNKELIFEYQARYIKDYEFLNRAAQLFAETNYPEDLYYDFGSIPARRHKLFHNEKDVSDIFPKIQEYMMLQYPDPYYCPCPYEIWYSKYIVYIELGYNLFNENHHSVLFLYSNNRNNIIKEFPSFKFYEYDIPDEIDSWLYTLDKNWYICSPTTSLWNDFVNKE